MPSSKTSTHFGFVAARQVVHLGRAAFFDAHRPDIPVAETTQIAADDLLPQFGFVGKRYEKRRVLLLGINPGNGPRGYRNAGDERQMPALEAFAANPTPENFLEAQRAYREVCELWRMWGRECSELLELTGLTIDEAAFTNAIPWRTASTSQFHKSVSRNAATLYVQPYLADLRPRILVAVGKKAAEGLEFIDTQAAQIVVWNRARAPTPPVLAERKVASELLVRLLGGAPE
jgi:hypothetical protein